MEKYLKQNSPFVVPTNDGKLIEEHFGLASTKENRFSIARMVAPPGWSEPFQTPEFDEVTFVVRGSKLININGEEEIRLNANESILLKAGVKVKYSNPFEDEVEYLSFCVPAFSIDTVNRETN